MYPGTIMSVVISHLEPEQLPIILRQKKVMDRAATAFNSGVGECPVALPPTPL